MTRDESKITDQEYKAITEYKALCHAMQTGVAMRHGQGCEDGSPKHLRVGVNAAMCDHAALVGLLIKHGVISNEEYACAIRDQMRAEVERYEQEIREHLSTGSSVKLV